jgi:hypothetical protein
MIGGELKWNDRASQERASQEFGAEFQERANGAQISKGLALPEII